MSIFGITTIPLSEIRSSTASQLHQRVLKSRMVHKITGEDAKTGPSGTLIRIEKEEKKRTSLLGGVVRTLETNLTAEKTRADFATETADRQTEFQHELLEKVKDSNTGSEVPEKSVGLLDIIEDLSLAAGGAILLAKLLVPNVPDLAKKALDTVWKKLDEPWEKMKDVVGGLSTDIKAKLDNVKFGAERIGNSAVSVASLAASVVVSPAAAATARPIRAPRKPQKDIETVVVDPNFDESHVEDAAVAGEATYKPGAQAAGAPLQGVTDLGNLLAGDNNIPGTFNQITATHDILHEEIDSIGNAHNQGRAMDFSIKGGKAQSAAAVQYLIRMLDHLGFTASENAGAPKDVWINNEYLHPIKGKTTGPHLHIQFESKEAAARFHELFTGLKEGGLAQRIAELDASFMKREGAEEARDLKARKNVTSPFSVHSIFKALGYSDDDLAAMAENKPKAAPFSKGIAYGLTGHTVKKLTHDVQGAVDYVMHPDLDSSVTIPITPDKPEKPTPQKRSDISGMLHIASNRLISGSTVIIHNETVMTPQKKTSTDARMAPMDVSSPYYMVQDGVA